MSRSMHSTLLKTGLGLTQVRKREVPWTDVCESLTAVHLGDPWTCAQAGAPRHRAARRALLASARSRHDQVRFGCGSMWCCMLSWCRVALWCHNAS